MATSAHSPDLALRATGLLRTFNDAGVLSAADVHVATRLGALLGETEETVLLAVALTVRSTRGGSVVVDLATAADVVVPDADEVGPDTVLDPVELPWPDTGAWLQACAASPLTSGGSPLTSEGSPLAGGGGSPTSGGGPVISGDGPLTSGGGSLAGGGGSLASAGQPAFATAAPLVLRGSRLWLSRYDAQEQQVVDELRSRTGTLPDDLDLDRLRAGLDRLFPRATDADQRVGAAVCALSRVSVLAGGPGTGKTTTVSRVLALLREQNPGCRIALAAPTGKAAARLEEAVRSSAAGFGSAGDREHVADLQGVTLHRLLGWQPGSRSRFRHNAANRLPFEVVVVDEASMVPLTMMARLLESLRPDTRLVLVGDPDQLASVEAGAVLGDLVDRAGLGRRTDAMVDRLDRVAPDHGSSTTPTSAAARLRDGIAALTVNHRFAAGSAIGALSDAVRLGDADRAVELLASGGDGVELVAVADDAPLTDLLLRDVRADVLGWGAALRTAATAGDGPAALQALDRHRLLCAHRRGPRGVQHWEWLALRWLAELDDGARRPDGYHPGQPLLVTTNDYEVGLFNGDTGVVVDSAGGRAPAPGEPSTLRAVFARGGEPTSIPLVRLGAVRPVHAMTVHRSQGSQFDRVTVVLPTAESPLATRETLYTAITRAVSQVRVIGSVEAFAAAVRRPAARATGLRDRL